MAIKIKTYFITGAEGVGKSSIVKILKKEFPKMDIHDFDEVGVPLNPPLQWRLNTSLYWIKKAIKNQNQNISTCVIGLCFPEEILSFPESKYLNKISFCLLDITEKERKIRLLKRKTSKSVIDDLENLHKLKKQVKKYDGKSINTTNLSIPEVGNEVVEWLSK